MSRMRAIDVCNFAQLVFRFHQVFHRDAIGFGKPSGDKDRAMYRRAHSRRDDDAVGQFGEGVTETGSQLGSDDQLGAIGADVLTVADVLRPEAIVCELYDVGFPAVPDLARALPH